MSGILALYGSGEFTDKMLQVDKFLLEKTANPRIAILPTAAGAESDHRKWIDMGVKHYQKLKFAAQGFDIKDRDDADSKTYANELSDYNYFVFSGGDPGYLLASIKDSLVWKTILEKYEKGATLIGSSAGAMVMGKKIWSDVYYFLENGDVHPWEDGLGVTDFGVIPHFDRMAKEFTNEQTTVIWNNFPKNITVVGIDENTAYIRIKNKWITKGSGGVYSPAII
jgi:cyanophycinase